MILMLKYAKSESFNYLYEKIGNVRVLKSRKIE